MSLFLPFSERNLILTGYVGPDTFGIGRQVAERLRMRYVNIEILIAERVGLPVDELRTYFGETRLKSIEAEIVQEATLRRSSLIRIGGRTLLNGSNLERIQETGPVICLVVTLNAMLHRLHMSMGARYHNPHERALALGELKREWAVRKQPNVHEVDTTYQTPEETIETVVSLWQSLAIERA